MHRVCSTPRLTVPSDTMPHDRTVRHVRADTRTRANKHEHDRTVALSPIKPALQRPDTDGEPRTARSWGRARRAHACCARLTTARRHGDTDTLKKYQPAPLEGPGRAGPGRARPGRAGPGGARPQHGRDSHADSKGRRASGWKHFTHESWSPPTLQTLKITDNIEKLSHTAMTLN